MKKQINLFAIIFFLSTFLSLFAQSPADSLLENAQPDSTEKIQTANLTVVITDLTNDKGNVRVALCNSKENYTGEKPYRAKIAEIKNGTASCTFENIPYGTYAVKFYHDENLNEELDKNLFGMPTEEYGFSNNATGNFGPASFEDAKFEIKEPEKTITITAQ